MQDILSYIDKRIETYKARSLVPGEKFADEFKQSAAVLGVLRGDLSAGLHLPDPQAADAA